MSIILDGKKIASELRTKIKNKVLNFKKKFGLVPGLAVIFIGNDYASKIYIKNKENACKQIGFKYKLYEFSNNVKLNIIIDLIKNLNEDKTIHGILIQLPLPEYIKIEDIIDNIDPKKDVDCFHPFNMGRLFLNRKPYHYPCTPLGIIRILKYYKIELPGRHIVVIGRSNLVGKPLAIMLLALNATVTICHTKTSNLISITKQADILICAIGKPEFITSKMIKNNSILIDVGVNLYNKKSIVGDINFTEVIHKTSYITPVPGGVGPMTIAMLLENTLCGLINQNK